MTQIGDNKLINLPCKKALQKRKGDAKNGHKVPSFHQLNL